MSTSIVIERAELMRLRDYAQWRDSIDALKLIDQILARDNEKTAEISGANLRPDYIDQHPAARGRRFTP